MSDFSTASTEALEALYQPTADKIKQLRAELSRLERDAEPLRDELIARHNKDTLILNAVMAGQQALLRASGASEEVIAKAEAKFAVEKARKESARKEKAVA